MRTEWGCERARVELSARLDGETTTEIDAALDEHLVGCAACSAHQRDLQAVRRALRLQLADPVPDLSPSIVRAISRVRAPASPWRGRVRAASLGAAAAIVILLGASLPWGDDPGDVAAAGEIKSGVRAAARSLTAYRAEFEIEERGWHPRVSLREMTAEVSFQAPESFRLEVEDLTPYPSGKWPANDSKVIANGRRWWIEEVGSCPTAALPACSVSGVERRGIAGRQPFDGTTGLPTDIVIPLETIASSDRFDVSGRETVLGRRAYRVVLDYRHALPLVGAIQAGGSWRPFEAGDRVEVWVDTETWFPLRFTVSKGPGRPPLLDVRATAFSTPSSFPPGTFRAPTTGLVKPGGWKELPFGEVPQDLVPADVAGLRPYRAGTTAEGKTVVTFARGMTWAKLSAGSATRSDLDYLLSSEEIKTPAAFLYYQPAGEALKRRVDLFDSGSGRHVQIESNLSRAELLRVAASLGVRGDPLPDRITTGGGAVVRRIAMDEALERVPFALRPSTLPPGYGSATALLSTARAQTSVTFFFRSEEAEYGGGIQITQSSPSELLTPTSEDPLAVRFSGIKGRWFPERGVLEWIEGRVHRSVTVPFGDLATATAVATGLR